MKRCIWRLLPVAMFVCCGFLNLPGRAAAQPGPPRDHSGRLERLVKEIGLDEKTQAEASRIIDASKVQHRELRQKLRTAHQQMHALLEQETPDETAVMAQADAIGTLETDVQKQRLRTMLQVRALLTPEQRTKLLELLRTKHSRGRHFRHERFGDQPSPPAQ